VGGMGSRNLERALTPLQCSGNIFMPPGVTITPKDPWLSSYDYAGQEVKLIMDLSYDLWMGADVVPWVIVL
jgi:hypothetical protein